MSAPYHFADRAARCSRRNYNKSSRPAKNGVRRIIRTDKSKFNASSAITRFAFRIAEDLLLFVES